MSCNFLSNIPVALLDGKSRKGNAWPKEVQGLFLKFYESTVPSIWLSRRCIASNVLPISALNLSYHSTGSDIIHTISPKVRDSQTL
jgi:hypothetical protein